MLMERNYTLWLPAVIIGALLFAFSVITIPIIWDKHRKTGEAFMITGSIGVVLILVTLSQFIWNTIIFNFHPFASFREQMSEVILTKVPYLGWLPILIIGVIGISATWKHRKIKTIFIVILVIGVVWFLAYTSLIIIAPFIN